MRYVPPLLMVVGSAELGMSVGAIVLAQSLLRICSLAVTALCKMCCVIASGVFFERSSYGV